MTRTWNGRGRSLAGLLAASLTVATLVLAGAGAAQATGVADGGTSPTTSSTTTSSSGSSDHSDGTASTQGSADQPQPVSGADQNSGGANGQCPGGAYCSTRDGSPSGNGNGTGNATGKPCAGCVGKADNKNPQGQKPNGSDANAGYECDRNHGIGRTNPAHTGCTAAGESPSPAPGTGPGDGQGCATDDSTPTSDQDCAPCAAGASMSGAEQSCAPCPAGASMSGSGPGCDTAGTPAVPGAGETAGAGRPPVVLGVQASRPAPRAAPAAAGVAGVAAAVLPDALLPNTGAGATLMLCLVVGAALALAGSGVLLLRRRSARP